MWIPKEKYSTQTLINVYVQALHFTKVKHDWRVRTFIMVRTELLRRMQRFDYVRAELRS